MTSFLVESLVNSTKACRTTVMSLFRIVWRIYTPGSDPLRRWTTWTILLFRKLMWFHIFEYRTATVAVLQHFPRMKTSSFGWANPRTSHYDGTEWKFTTDASLGKQYVAFMEEYLPLGHMLRIGEDQEPTKRCFLPSCGQGGHHHEVHVPHSASEYSLNNALLVEHVCSSLGSALHFPSLLY